MGISKEKLEVLKEKAIEVSVDFLHFLSRTEDFNKMTRESIRSACCSAIKTQIGRTHEVELCRHAEESLDAIILIVKDLNKDCIYTNRLSNGKTIVEMTEKEYLDTDEGSLDVFASDWEKAQEMVEKEKQKKINHYQNLHQN